MSIKLLIKSFELSEDERPRIDLSGGLRLNPGGENQAARLEVPIDENGYVLDQDLTARTWVTNPQTVIQWIGFQVDAPGRPKDPDDFDSPGYVARYRLNDGAGDFYHDGLAWAAATDPGLHWNSEGEIATNIETFPATSQMLGVVVNMWTISPLVTPSLARIKVLYKADIVEISDLLIDSLIPELREAMTFESRFVYVFTAASDTLDLSDLPALEIETPYDLIDVRGAFDFDLDPNRQTDLVDTFDTNTKLLTLSSVQPIGTRLYVSFAYQPVVVYDTNQDYREFATLPAVKITNFIGFDKGFSYDDAVFNVDTNQGWRVLGPKMTDYQFKLEAVSDKVRDTLAMGEAIEGWIDKRLITMRGTDEDYAVQIDQLGSDLTAAPNAVDLQKQTFSGSILNVRIHRRPAEPATKLAGANFDFGEGADVELSP